MKDIKYRWNTLCLYDYRGVENHLSAMAAQGWRLEKAGNTLWKYRRAEPAQVRYAVTYSAGASQFNPGPTEGQESLAELCAAAGWEKVCDWFQMQIFSTEDEHAVPLETDEALRLENIHRSLGKNFLLTNLILLVLGLVMSFAFLGTLFVRPLRFFESNARLFSGALFLLVALLEIYTFCHYYGWRRRSRRSIEEGGPCAPINTRAYQRLNRAGLVLVGLLVAVWLLTELASGGRGYALFYVVYLPLFVLLVVLVRQTTVLMRRLKAPKWVNMAATLAVDFILAFGLIGGLTFCAIRFGWFFGGREAGETYLYQDMEWDAAPRQDFPLTLADLTGEEYGHIRRWLSRQGSFFLQVRNYNETVLPQDGRRASSIQYRVWDVKLPRLREPLLDDLLETQRSLETHSFTSSYVAEDPLSWDVGGSQGPEAVYRRWNGNKAAPIWVLVWPDRVVFLVLESQTIPLGESPAQEQINTIIRCLGPGA